MLAEVPIFASLELDALSLLAERTEVVTAKKGTTLFSVGDPGDSMFVVMRGTAELFVKTKTGERFVLETAERGDFFGEVSLLDPGPRSASCVVTEDLEALCVDQGDLEELLRLRPEAAMDLLSATGKRLRFTAGLLRNTVTRNVNEEVEDSRTRVMKVTDWIADFSGSLPFLFLHIGIFFVWIVLNVDLLPWGGFDPFPFGLLTLAVSLEAIILSVFVLLSQSRQVARDRVRGDVAYDVNLKAEMQIEHLHEKFDRFTEAALERLERLEQRSLKPPQSAKGAPPSA
jgi:uncharacterized membrane protein